MVCFLGYRVFIAAEVSAFLRTCGRREQFLITRLPEQLASDPFRAGDGDRVRPRPCGPQAGAEYHDVLDQGSHPPSSAKRGHSGHSGRAKLANPFQVRPVAPGGQGRPQESAWPRPPSVSATRQGWRGGCETKCRGADPRADQMWPPTPPGLPPAGPNNPQSRAWAARLP